jgi:hypothetical protein
LKITDIINTKFRPQKTLEGTRIKLYNTLVLPALLYGSENWTTEARDTRRITAAGRTYNRKNSRIHLDRVYNKHRDCKRTKYYPNFGQNTEI